MTESPARPSASLSVPTVAAAVVTGVLVGLAATMLHRVSLPLPSALPLPLEAVPAGLIGAFVLVAFGGVFARAAADLLGVVLHAFAVFLTAAGLAFLGRAQDVLIADDAVSRVFLLALPVVAVLLPKLTPSAWYRDEPAAASPPPAGDVPPVPGTPPAQTPPAGAPATSSGPGAGEPR